MLSKETVSGYHMLVWSRHLHRLQHTWKPKDFVWLVKKQLQEFNQHYNNHNALKMKNEVSDIICLCYSCLWFLGEKTAKQQDKYILNRMKTRMKGKVLQISQKYGGK